MNLEYLKRSVGHHVNLHPIAVRLGEKDNELDTIDDDWVIKSVSSTGIEIHNISTGHTKILGSDHVHHYTSNPGRSAPGITYGFLTLTVQLFLKGREVRVRPTSRPGERTTLDGRPVEDRSARARLLDERLQAVLDDYRYRGSPQPMIDTFNDLTQAEKADLYDRAVQLKKGRPSKNNPFR